MQNEKTSVVTAGSFQSLIAGAIKDDLFPNYEEKEQKLQADLTAHLVQHRSVRRLCRCFGCENPKSPLKMSTYPAICRECISKLKGKGKTARSHFIERVKSNVGRFLRTAVAL